MSASSSEAGIFGEMDKVEGSMGGGSIANVLANYMTKSPEEEENDDIPRETHDKTC